MMALGFLVAIDGSMGVSGYQCFFCYQQLRSTSLEVIAAGSPEIFLGKGDGFNPSEKFGSSKWESSPNRGERFLKKMFETTTQLNFSGGYV